MMDEKIKRINKRKESDRLKLQVLIAIFSLISFYTSYTGLIKLSGVSEYNYVLKVFIGVLIGGIQLALVYSINAFYFKDLFRKDWFKSVALISLYVITMSFSVIFSFSYWYEEFSAENYAKRSSDMQLMAVKKSLMRAKESFSFMSVSLLSLSNYSTTASNREKRLGGTCDPSVGSGEGVYTWLRADDASYTKSYSTEIQKLQSKLDVEIDKVSRYIEEFNPNGDVVKFNRMVNDSINRINVKFFNNQTLNDLERMLVQRSGQNRKRIVVTNRKTNQISKHSCMDREFTRGATKVIQRIRALKTIKNLEFFDKSDTQKLFGRTVAVLKALVTLSEIKSVNKATSPDDITSDDVNAVLAGFVIDFLILLIAIIGKEEKEELIPYHVVQDILNGKHSNEIWTKLKLYRAEMYKVNLIAVPNDIDSEEVDNLKQLMLYFQQEKLAKLYINEIKVSRLNHYFTKALKESYPNEMFRVYKINKKKFNKFLLQNVKQGVYHV